ncbi:MAG: hypothetical protein RLY30_1832 [Pseudomonadota bacterium]
MAIIGEDSTLSPMEPSFSLCPNQDQRQLIEALDRRVSAIANPGASEDVLVGLDELGLIGAQLPEDQGGLDQSLPTMTLIHERLGYWRTHPSVLEETVILTDLLGIPGPDLQTPSRACMDQAIWAGKPTGVSASMDESGNWHLSGMVRLHRPPSPSDRCLILFPDLDGQLRLAEARLGPIDPSFQCSPLQPEQIQVGFVDLEVIAQEPLPSFAAARPAWAVLRAAELLGWSQSVLEQCVSYVQQREQFGGPIARFQAVQHALARMMVAIEAARSAVYGASCLLSTAKEGPQWSHAAQAVLESRSAARFCTQEAIQIHGGMGYTKDCGLDRPLLTAYQIEAQLNQMIDWNKAIAP